ncbi:MAG TPA: PfkB family carbohydrate kinase [Bryocella sp.]|nr:PfkB family carbohydrate kinase [Bryocella sp.]
MSNSKGVDLVGVGLNATDTLIRLSEFPQRGSKLEYDVESLMPGGQVASTVVACQTWGLRTRYVGKLGDDEASRLHAREFDRTGVEAKLVNVAEASSPKSLILVDPDGERTVLCRRDERLILQPEELRSEWITDARALHVDGHDTAAAIQAASWAREAGLAVIADLDEIYPGVDALIEKIDYLIVSRDFPARLTGEKNLVKALREIQTRYGCQLTAATLGPGGVLAWNGETVHYAPAYRVPVVDTTGAGDIFHAGFIFALLHGWPLQRQLDFACAAAAMNCMAEGARGGINSLESVLNFTQTTPHYDESVERVLQAEMSF